MRIYYLIPFFFSGGNLNQIKIVQNKHKMYKIKKNNLGSSQNIIFETKELKKLFEI